MYRTLFKKGVGFIIEEFHVDEKDYKNFTCSQCHQCLFYSVDYGGGSHSYNCKIHNISMEFINYANIGNDKELHAIYERECKEYKNAKETYDKMRVAGKEK